MEINFDVFDKKCSGVYMIKNVLNNHKYIGSTKNFKQRLKQHLSDLRNNKHHSPHLQAAWNKYGEKHFVFQILETCEPIKDTLMLCIKAAAEAVGVGKNASIIACCQGKYTQSGGYIWKYKHDADDVERRYPAYYKKVIQKDKNGNIINTYHSATEAADALLKHELMNKNRKIVSCAISMCARGISKTAYKYVWEYEN